MDATVRMIDMPVEETLDPDDWKDHAQAGHRAVDDAIAFLRSLRDQPVWQDVPEPVRARFSEPLPLEGEPLAAVLDRFAADVLAYPMGNVHPRFWAWFMGTSSFTGALADFLAGIQGSNLGGGNHAAALLDRQVVNWCKEMVGFPADASGTLTSGGSMANLIGLAVARNAKAGIDIRELGIAAVPAPLCFYSSDQVHSCHRKAVEALGLGNRALRRIPSDAEYRIDLDLLRRAIQEDRAAGLKPACLIGNAGTVNTGAIDDLEALVEIARKEELWFHVDGCIGALLAIAPKNRALVAGLDRADSLALDPHKWLHAPFDVGCCLVKDAAAHFRTFATMPEYLQTAPRGLASGEWLHEYGLGTSSSFRALKVWMMLKEHGVEMFGRLIDQNLHQAHYVTRRVQAEPCLRLMAPASINIVCFRYQRPDLDEAAIKALNTQIMLHLQEEGNAVVSDTTLRGQHSLRVAICNHRTRLSDLDILIDEVLKLGRTLEKREARED